MEVTGKVEKILPVISGETKKGDTWQKQTFVIRTSEEYNNLYPIEAFGKAMEQMSKLKVGQTVTAKFNVNANEYQGKYYVSLGLWKVDVDEDVVSKQKPEMAAQEAAFEADSELPF